MHGIPQVALGIDTGSAVVPAPVSFPVPGFTRAQVRQAGIQFGGELLPRLARGMVAAAGMARRSRGQGRPASPVDPAVN